LKTTGVSRRIDDLGRIVIPKEIRKTLKIRSGELLEIMVDEDNIILSKHSTMKSISDTANICVDAVSDSGNINILITDRDRVIAASPSLRKKYLDKDLNIDTSEQLMKLQSTIEKDTTVLKIDNENEEQTAFASYPIIVEGDIVGLVIILGLGNKLTEADEKVAEVISKFLSHNIL
jgi:AbrB family transcriptional regulator (stage V sporulation protein T)